MHLKVALFLTLLSPYGWGGTTSSLAGLPVNFERNEGQWPYQVEFSAHIRGHQYEFSSKGIAIDGAIHLDLPSSAKAKFEGVGPVETRSNYLRGRDPHNWVTGVRNYSRIQYRDAFPGIDLILYGTRGELEFDYVAAPGANPDLIRFHVRGASPRLSAADLELVGEWGDMVKLREPQAYQETPSGRRSVACHFRIRKPSEITFTVSQFDHALPLVIDPILTYLYNIPGTPVYSGSLIASDAAGSFFLGGTVSLATIPTPSSGLRTKSNCPVFSYYPNCEDGWAMKYNPDIGRISWATYIGGSNLNYVYGLALDSAGNVILVGATCSQDFPITPDAYLSTMPTESLSGCAGFLAKLNPTGTAMVYATFLNVIPIDVTLDAQGAIYCRAGATVQKLSADGKAVLLTIQLSNAATGPTFSGNIAVDGSGNIFVLSQRLPDFQVTAGAYKDSDNDQQFVMKFDADGNLVFSASLNASKLSDMLLDPAGNIVIAAGAAGAGAPVVNDPDPQPNDCETGVQCMAYIVALDSTGSFLRYTRLLGDGVAQKLAFDSKGNLYVAGFAYNSNPTFTSGFFPRTLDAFQYCSSPMDGNAANKFAPNRTNADAGTQNGFIMILDAQGHRTFSSFSGTITTTVSYLHLSDNGMLYLGGWGNQIVVQGGGFYFVAAIDTTQAPPIPHACLVNATQNIPDANPNDPTVARGEMVTLFGEGIGPQEPAYAQWSDQGTIATQLAGVQVLFDGVPAPILYAQYNQINCIVPFGVAGHQSTTAVAQYAGLQTAPMTLQVVPAVVKVFTKNFWPDADVIAINEDGTMNSADQPAARGSVITLFAIGGGLTSTPLNDGQIVSTAAAATSPVQAYFYTSPYGSVTKGDVQYFGTAPRQVAGFYQLNVQVPSDAATGRTHITIYSLSGEAEGIWLK